MWKAREAEFVTGLDRNCPEFKASSCYLADTSVESLGYKTF